MNTLKMKVLLMLSNRYLHRSVWRAILVWFTTNLAGCTLLRLLGFFFLQSDVDFVSGLILSLIFSSPALFIAAWVIYKLPEFSTWRKRISVSLLAILLTSASIIAFVAQFFQLPYPEVASVLYPFTLSAIAIFFLINRKQIVTLY